VNRTGIRGTGTDTRIESRMGGTGSRVTGTMLREGLDQGNTERGMGKEGIVEKSKILTAGTMCTNIWSRQVTPRTKQRGLMCWRGSREGG